MKSWSEYFKKTLLVSKTQNHPLFVYENLIHRWLCFDDKYVQTIINKYAPHRPVLAYLPALCANLATHFLSKNEAVMLGAGGGAIYHFVNKYYPLTKLTLVEHDISIIEVAEKHFHVKQPIIHNSAENFLTSMAGCPHLFIDIFVDNKLPSSLSQESFLKLCQKKSNYCVSFNVLTDSAAERYEIIHKIRQVFNNQTLCLAIKKRNNIIVHAYVEANYLDNISQLSSSNVIYTPQWHDQMGLFSMMR